MTSLNQEKENVLPVVMDNNLNEEKPEKILKKRVSGVRAWVSCKTNTQLFMT